METHIPLANLAAESPQPALHHWANLLFVLISALSILIAIRPAGASGGGLPEWLDPGLAMILAQVSLILIPALLFVWLTRQPVRTALKLRRLSLSTSAKCVLIGLLCWPIFQTLTSLAQFGLAVLSPAQAGDSLDTATGGGSPWLLFIGIAVVAPVCEETLFRGVLFSAYEKAFGPAAIWLAGILFSLFHFDMTRILGALFVGCIAGWLVFHTRSIWSGMLVHCGVNLLGGLMNLLLALAVPAGAEGAMAEAAAQAGDPMATFLLGMAVWGGVGLVMLVPIYFLLRSIGKRNPAPAGPAVRPDLKIAWSSIAVLLLALVYTGAQWVFVMGK